MARRTPGTPSAAETSERDDGVPAAVRGGAHTMDTPRSEEDRAGLDVTGRLTDRRDRDGMAGAGDMLGGLSTGAGGTLGINDPDGHEFDPGPISGHQHDLENVEPRTDSATNFHAAGQPPTEGA